jgi:hypothetical protein
MFTKAWQEKSEMTLTPLFDFLQAMIENGNLYFPTLLENQFYSVYNGEVFNYHSLLGKPVEHLLLQMLTVKDLGANRCPGKGDGFTDDIFRALVLITKIHEPKVMERLKVKLNFMGDKKRTSPLPIHIPKGRR